MFEFPLKHHHGALSVPNLDEAIDWYRNILEFRVEQRFALPGGIAEVAMLRRDELRIELFEAAGSLPAAEDRRHPNRDIVTQGNKHVAFAVPDVHAAAQALRERGADIVFVKDFEFGSNAFIRDNAGNLLELVQQPDLWSGLAG